jgi:hypothetical protein
MLPAKVPRLAKCVRLGQRIRGLDRRRLLGLDPLLELTLRVNDDPEAHVGVRHAAVLGALPGVLGGNGRDVGRHDEPVHAVRHDVTLAAEMRHPEGVDHVGRVQVEGRRAPSGKVQLVGGGDLVVGVPELPPPLMADDVDVEVRRRRGLLGPEDDLDGRDADDQEDHGERDRPRDLERRVSVDLLGDGRARPLAEAPAAVEQAPLDRHEDHERGPRDQHEDLVDPPAEVRPGPDGRHGVVPEIPAAGRREQEHRQKEESRPGSGEADVASDHDGPMSRISNVGAPSAPRQAPPW